MTTETPPPAFYEERIRLLEEKLQQAIGALREQAKHGCIFQDGVPCAKEWPNNEAEWCSPCFAGGLLLKLGEQP